MILSELNSLFETINIPVETGIFSGEPPVEYIVLTPLSESFAVFGDNKPLADISEVRISLFSKNNYIKRKNQLVMMLIQADFVITDRRYIGFEENSEYHHYCIDVSQYYEL